MNIRPHTYGPKSLPAFTVRYVMRRYLDEAKRAKGERPLAHRACVKMAWLLRSEFRAARIVMEV